MDWITGIQRAIDYIEENLTGTLDYDAIAGCAYSSGFHFQRVFGILCGCTLGEYIRARRLTLAGSELASTDIRVIDAALKYGYDSPESFARAFVRFHGIAPSQAKTPGTNLKSFSRLSVKLIMEGGTLMDYRIETKKAFRVVEKAEQFSTDAEISREQIPEFWTRAKNGGVIEALCALGGGSEFADVLLGICYDENADGSHTFPYGIATGYGGALPIPAGLRVTQIPAHTWAVFKCVGAMPTAIQQTWCSIYSEFFPTSDYSPIQGISFELYTDGDMSSPGYKSEIWIAVEKK